MTRLRWHRYLVSYTYYMNIWPILYGLPLDYLSCHDTLWSVRIVRVGIICMFCFCACSIDSRGIRKEMVISAFAARCIYSSFKVGLNIVYIWWSCVRKCLVHFMDYDACLGDFADECVALCGVVLCGEYMLWCLWSVRLLQVNGKWIYVITMIYGYFLKADRLCYGKLLFFFILYGKYK